MARPAPGEGLGGCRWLASAELLTAAGRQPGHNRRDLPFTLTRPLSGAGYRVAAVSDGQQALEAVRASAPDLLVSDVMMPNRDGLSLLGALRADPRTAAVPVLLPSARAGQEASIEGCGRGLRQRDRGRPPPLPRRPIRLRAEAHAEGLRLTVTDSGEWKAPVPEPDAYRGRASS